MFELSCRVYSASGSKEGVLSKYDNDWPKMSGNASGCVNKLECIELVVGNAGDINSSLMLIYDARVVANDSSIGSSVDK